MKQNMLFKIINKFKPSTTVVTINRLSHTQNGIVESVTSEDFQVLDTRSLPNADHIEIAQEKLSVLEPCKEDISHVATYLQPSFNFAAYANKSNTLQQLVKLGVNLHKLEKRVSVPPFILGLDFEKDIKSHIMFLHDLGLSLECIANFFTKNPYILKQRIDDLTIRINYLSSKKISNDMITRIVSANPFWLMFSTQRIDRRLGFFQQEFLLSGNQVRQLTVQQPKLITYSLKCVKLNTFVIKEEMGFNSEETKAMLLNKPNLFMKDQNKLLKTFEFIHRNMNISLETIAQLPEALTCREFRIKQRHLFLQHLGRAQYDSKMPNYVSLLALISRSDAEFCTEVAKSSVQAFNIFLKSL